MALAGCLCVSSARVRPTKDYEGVIKLDGTTLSATSATFQARRREMALQRANGMRNGKEMLVGFTSVSDIFWGSAQVIPRLHQTFGESPAVGAKNET